MRREKQDDEKCHENAFWCITTMNATQMPSGREHTLPPFPPGSPRLLMIKVLQGEEVLDFGSAICRLGSLAPIGVLRWPILIVLLLWYESYSGLTLKSRGQWEGPEREREWSMSGLKYNFPSIPLSNSLNDTVWSHKQTDRTCRRHQRHQSGVNPWSILRLH